MTFHQWAAASGSSGLPTSCRLAFETVWDALIGGGCSPSNAASMLSDILETIPRQEADYDEDD